MYASDVTFDQENQTVHGSQIAIGTINGDNVTITGGERPRFFAGVPDFPRHGLIGRGALLNDVIERLTGGGEVSLATTGIGGTGKTALALAVARNQKLLRHFSDGILWASVGPTGDPARQLSRWAIVLGIDRNEYPKTADLKWAVEQAIGQRRLLLVIDDIWESQHGELLRCGGPNCAHLLTSRENSIAREFAGARNGVISVPDLEEERAFDLLRKIAPEACEVDEAAARGLARKVGGLPVALELLGGYLTEDGAPDANLFPDLNQERLQKLGDPELLLQQAKSPLGDETGAVVSLENVLHLSLDMLGNEEQAAYYALGAFAPKPAVFDREAAEAVCRTDGVLLNRFVNQNLLEINGKYFALHQVLADLAGKYMDSDARERHATFYLALVNKDRHDWQSIDNTYSQIGWAWAHVGEDDCLPWVWALHQHQEVRGYWKDNIEWLKKGLNCARKINCREDEARLLSFLGKTYNRLGQYKKALRHCDMALPIMGEVANYAGEAHTLNNIGSVYENQDRQEDALPFYQEALQISRREGNRAGEARALNNMGAVYRDTGSPEKAISRFAGALQISRDLGEPANEAVALHSMGLAYLDLGEHGENTQKYARKLFDRALIIRRALGDRAGVARTLIGIAILHSNSGQPDKALHLYEEVLLITHEVNDRSTEATALYNMAKILHEMNRLPEAIDRAKEGRALFSGGFTHSSRKITANQFDKLLRELQPENID